MATTQRSTNAPVAWFEVATDDPGEARRFYSEMFGWSFSDSPEATYSFVSTGPGDTLPGGLQDTRGDLPEGAPSSWAIFYVLVDDVAGTCARVEEQGGKVLVPATATPTGLVFAHVADPAGNRFGLFRPPGG